MLNNDIIKIIGTKEITKDRLRSLLLLYKEFLSHAVIDLYLSLLCLKHDHYYKCDAFLKTIGLNVERLEDMMHDLERNGLIRTYYRTSEYLIELLDVKKVKDFFEDETLVSSASFKNKERISFLKGVMIKDRPNLEGYREISEKRLKKDDHDDEGDAIKDVKERYVFPIQELLDTTSTVLLPKELRNFDDLDKIAKYGELYNISVDDMRKYLNRSIITGKDLHIDYATLERYCIKGEGDSAYEGDGYAISPMTFLKNLRKVKNLTTDDRRMIRNLASDENYALNNSVINVLLEYVYDRFGSNLNRSMIYSIANEWHYKDIDTAEKAKKALSDFKTVNKTSTKEDIIPVYDDSHNPVMSEEDMLRFKKYIQGDDHE